MWSILLEGKHFMPKTFVYRKYFAVINSLISERVKVSYLMTFIDKEKMQTNNATLFIKE